MSAKTWRWWYRWLPDGLFFLPTGLWGILAGGLLSIAVSVLTSIRFQSQAGLSQTAPLVLSTLLFALAAFGFAWLSLFIESHHKRVASPLDIEPAIRRAKSQHASLLLGSLTLVVMAFVFLFLCI